MTYLRQYTNKTIVTPYDSVIDITLTLTAIVVLLGMLFYVTVFLYHMRMP